MSSPANEIACARSKKGEISPPPSLNALNSNDDQQQNNTGVDDSSKYRVRDGIDNTSGLNPYQHAESSMHAAPSILWDDESFASLEDSNARPLSGDAIDHISTSQAQEYDPLPPLPQLQMPNDGMQDLSPLQIPNDDMQDVGQMLAKAGFASGNISTHEEEDTHIAPINNPSPLLHQPAPDTEINATNDAKHPAEAYENEETRTKTERYYREGRGSQNCNLCGKPRKKHICEFQYPSANECKEMRVKFLAGFLSIGGDKALKSCREALESRRAATVVSNQSDQELRTKSSRYHTEGRGPQSCNLCGKPRKKHACLFEPVTSSSVEDFVERKLVDVVRVWVRIIDDLNDDSGEDVKNTNVGRASKRRKK